MAIVEDIEFVNFDYVSGIKDPLEIEPENDLYAPLLKGVN